MGGRGDPDFGESPRCSGPEIAGGSTKTKIWEPRVCSSRALPQWLGLLSYHLLAFSPEVSLGSARPFCRWSHRSLFMVKSCCDVGHQEPRRATDPCPSKPRQLAWHTVGVSKVRRGNTSPDERAPTGFGTREARVQIPAPPFIARMTSSRVSGFPLCEMKLTIFTQ